MMHTRRDTPIRRNCVFCIRRAWESLERAIVPTVTPLFCSTSAGTMNNKTVINVAIAEDHKLLRESVCDSINRTAGFKMTLVAENGHELINKLEHSDNIPDLLILDLGMPVMDGYTTLPIVKEKWPSIKVLVLSMYDDEYSIIRVLKNGAGGYILKGMGNPKELHNALQSIYTTGYYFSDTITEEYYKVAQKTQQPELTKKELEFLKYCCSELSFQEIAAKMEISVRTVEGYSMSLYKKLNVKNRVGLVLFVMKTGIVQIEP